jgi:hypothetical protein
MASDVRAALVATIPCKFSNYALSDDQQTLFVYASPLDDQAKAAQPEAAAELQRERVESAFRWRVFGGVGLAKDGRLDIQVFVDTQEIADQLRRDIDAEVADKSPIEQQLPSAAPLVDITVGVPRFTYN